MKYNELLLINDIRRVVASFNLSLMSLSCPDAIYVSIQF